MGKKRRKEPGAPEEPLATLEVRELARLRLLADPLRLRLIHAFAEKARTTKQVADLLDLPATRLYHHVAQLEEAGLIRLTATRPVRGTVEKYYRAVARRFVASPAAFTKGPEADAAGRLALQVIEQARGDVELLLARTNAGETDPDGCDPVLARATVFAPAGRVRELRERMLEWLAELEALEENEDGASPDGSGTEERSGGTEAGEAGGREDAGADRAYSVTLAFLPTETPG